MECPAKSSVLALPKYGEKESMDMMPVVKNSTRRGLGDHDELSGGITFASKSIDDGSGSISEPGMVSTRFLDHSLQWISTMSSEVVHCGDP